MNSLNPFCFYQGAIVHKNEIFLSIDDLGFSRGYALFEHCRTYSGKVFHLKEHYLRLVEGAEELQIPFVYSLEELEKWIYLLFEKNNFVESGFKIYLTLGIAKEGLLPSTEPTFIIYPYPLPSYQPHSFEKGLTLQTTLCPRAFSHIKTTFYLPGLQAKRKAPHVDEILFLDTNHHILESTIASFLAFSGDTLLIPEGSLLKSVTQEALYKIAKSHFKIERRSISIHELSHITEAFLSSSTKEIVPIEKIDDHLVGEPRKYKNTLQLKNLLEDYIQNGKWDLLSSFEKNQVSYSFSSSSLA